MINIESLVEQGEREAGTLTDLKMFAESIVQRTIRARQEEPEAGDAAWRKRRGSIRNRSVNYQCATASAKISKRLLVPSQGRHKNMYAKSDIRRIQTGGKK